MAKRPKQPEPPKAPCPDCGGRGWRAVGTDEVPCERCDGTGKV